MLCTQLLEGSVLANAEVGLHLDAHVGDGLDLSVQNCLGQTVLGDAVTQHAAQLGHCFVDGDSVTGLAQEECCGQTSGAAADDADGLAGVSCDLGLVGILGCQVLITGESLQEGDGDGLLDHLTAACGLTGVGADTADGCGQGQLLLDGCHGAMVIALGDLLDVQLAVGAGGAVQDTGTTAVAVVVGHQQLQSDLTGLDNTLGLGVDDHAVSGQGGAGTQQLGALLSLNDTDAAGAVVLDVLVMAQGGDVDTATLCDLQNGLALLADTFHTIDNNLDFTHFGLPPYSTTTAPLRQELIHWPQRMHFAGSMAKDFFSSPEIAPTGHFLAHREQPMHFSASME